MRLRAATLLTELCKAFPAREMRIAADSMELERPLLYTDGIPLLDRRIYIVGAEMERRLSAVPESALLLVTGTVADTAIGKGNLSYCRFSADTTAAALLNAVQAMFDRHDAWDAALRLCVDSDGDLDELLNLAASLLGNPVMVCAEDYSILARSNTIEDGGEVLGTHVSYKLIQRLKMNAAFQQLAGQRLPYRFREPDSGSAILCQNLYRDEDFAYRVIVADAQRPITPQSEALLERIAGYVLRLLSDNRFSGALYVQKSRSSHAEALLKAVIADERVDFLPVISGLSEISWLPAHRYCLVCAQIGSLDYRAHTAKLLCHQVETLLRGSCAFEHGGNIVALINLDLYGGDAADMHGQLVYFLRDNFLKAGVSDEFTGFYDMFYYHRQALIALDFVCRLQSYRWVVRFSDIALPYMGEQCMRELPLHVVCSRKVLLMQRYDEEHDTAFYQTLACYIENRFNALQTAKKLFIHRSTFLYRMERIKDLFKIDLEDDDALLYTMLSMKMISLHRSLGATSELPYEKEG